MTHIYINVQIYKCTYTAPKFGKNTKAMEVIWEKVATRKYLCVFFYTFLQYKNI